MNLDDGYNLFAQLKTDKGTVRIEYRPALRSERWVLFNRIVMLQDEEYARSLMEQEIWRRVVGGMEAGKLTSDEKSFEAVFRCVMGQSPRYDERADEENLREGVRLLVRYPGMASVTCQDCQKWQMDPITGKVWKRGGKPLPRLKEDVLLCQTNEGCPKGSPQNEKGLSAKNKRALKHFLECRATGLFPDDAIVKRNARIISEELDRA